MNKLMILTLMVWSMTTHAEPASIDGQWLSQDETTWIEISQSKPEQWQGVIIKSSAKPEHKGQQILSSVTRAQTNYKGKVYAIKTGKHHDAELTLEDDTLQIKVKAGFISKTLIWTRIK